MSRIYEALRQAEESRSGRELRSGGNPIVPEMPNLKCSARWELGIHIMAYGRSLDECPFYEEVKAFSVNSEGGLLLLSVPVCQGQNLLLVNNRTSQEQICRVVHTRVRDVQTSEVAVAFPSPNPHFWQDSEIPVKLAEF
jgi:hypothetical protein